MHILFDNGTPAPLRYALSEHFVVEVIERGWDRLANGQLIAAAEAAVRSFIVKMAAGTDCASAAP